MLWRIGKWNEVSGIPICCVKGLHASLTPRDSVRHVYGKRWFIAEARGENSHQSDKFAASEMRLVDEILPIVLRRFAVLSARRSFEYIESRRPIDERLLHCIQATEGYLDGMLAEEDLLEGRRVATAVVAADAAMGPDAARAAAAAISASNAANGDAASWTAAAAGAAYAAHTAADAIEAAAALVAAHGGGSARTHNVAKGFDVADIADRAASSAHIAAADGAVAHAAAVAAASGVYGPDVASDRYFAAWSAATAHPVDSHYSTQNMDLLELIAESRDVRA
jgi:hypothetical protein